ncbi:MAG TPA: ROK family protein [Spirochaetota bacterium]|nr:ROK family protein [Spirochaetota bacterium]
MFIGFDIGGTNIKSLLTDENGNILKFLDNRTPSSVKGIELTLRILIESLCTESKTQKSEIKAIGIGAAGTINRKKGIVITSPNIPAWNNYNICSRLKKITGIDVFLENDATAACAGIWWSKIGKKYTNFITVTLGTGIGGGAVIDGKLFTGQNGSSMEIGHMSLDPEGELCPCGNRGCFELFSSATAIVKFVLSQKKLLKDSTLSHYAENQIDSKIIFQEAIKGDPLSLMAFERAATFLGIGIANLINILNPEAVIIGGGLSAAEKLLLPKAKEIAQQRAMKGLKENVKIIALKNQSIYAALGAAKIAKDNMDY